jgi:hypothetical protein
MHDTDVREIFSGGLETTSPRPDELVIVMNGSSGWGLVLQKCNDA